MIIVHHAIQRNGKANALCMYLDAYLSEPACWGIYVLYIHLSIFVGFMYHHADQCYAMLGCMHSFSQFQVNWHVEEMYLCTVHAPKAHFDPRNISCSAARPRQSLFHVMFGKWIFFVGVDPKHLFTLFQEYDLILALEDCPNAPKYASLSF